MEGERPVGRPMLRWKGSALEETNVEMEGERPVGRPMLRWKGSALEEDQC